MNNLGIKNNLKSLELHETNSPGIHYGGNKWQIEIFGINLVP